MSQDRTQVKMTGLFAGAISLEQFRHANYMRMQVQLGIGIYVGEPGEQANRRRKPKRKFGKYSSTHTPGQRGWKGEKKDRIAAKRRRRAA